MGLFLYYVTIKTLPYDKISIDFSLMCRMMNCQNSEKVKYSISMFEVRSTNNEYDLHSYTGFAKGEPVIIDWFDASREIISRNKYICKIKFYEVDNCSENLLKSIDSKHIDQICKDFAQLLSNKNLGDDVILKSGDTELSANRNILAARSPVFAAMFSNDMKESKEGVVLIDDIEPDILRVMLDFIYTNKVKDLESKAFDLYKVADRYDLEGLKIMCAEVLSRIMSTRNVVDIFVLADFYINENLKSEALDFIKLHLKIITKSPEFQSLKNTNHRLAIDILSLLTEP